MSKSLQIEDNEISDLLNGMIKDSVLKKLKRLYNKKPIKISSRKAKGRGLQKWVCQRISEMTGIPYEQSDDSCLIHSREMGQAGTDVVLRGEAAELFPYSCECKNAESFNIKETVKQVVANKKKDTDILIVYKCKEFKKPVVIIEWDKFQELEKESQGKRKIDRLYKTERESPVRMVLK
jgi:hypothetical protein